MDPETALAHFRVISLQVSATLAQFPIPRHVPAHRVVGEAVPDFVNRLKSQPYRQRKMAIRRFVKRASRYGRALIEGSTVFFFYAGKARRVTVPGEFNEWDPSADVMSHVRGTNFHWLARDVPRNARVEYKIAVDSTWILDPYNHQQAIGGSGPNSEIAMPAFHPVAAPGHRPVTRHGDIDSMSIGSTLLKRSHPVFVYRPHGYSLSERQYPSLYVLDGGDYLSLGMMTSILDTMIAERRIRPIVVIFVEPRTDVSRPGTNKRTTDYTMSDSFVDFLTQELRPAIERKYHLRLSARKRGIMGASLGGLLATYASYQRPHIFSFCAAQSPSYWWNQEAIIAKIAHGPIKPVRYYLDTGTIQDSLETSRSMRDVLAKKGYRFTYAEHPEGHNWGNWRARIPDVLDYFQGLP